MSAIVIITSIPVQYKCAQKAFSITEPFQMPYKLQLLSDFSTTTTTLAADLLLVDLEGDMEGDLVEGLAEDQEDPRKILGLMQLILLFLVEQH
jgi:hypothetical protein